MPFVIEYVKGIMTIVKKAGTALLMFSQSILPASPIIMAPINTKTGAVAAGGTDPNNGDKKVDIKNNTPMVMEVNPVRPPSFTPEALSTPTISGVEPVIAAIIVPIPAARKTHIELSTVPSSLTNPPSCNAMEERDASKKLCSTA